MMERALLVAAVVEPEVLDHAASAGLRAEHFADAALGEVFALLADLRAEDTLHEPAIPGLVGAMSHALRHAPARGAGWAKMIVAAAAERRTRRARR